MRAPSERGPRLGDNPRIHVLPTRHEAALRFNRSSVTRAGKPRARASRNNQERDIPNSFTARSSACNCRLETPSLTTRSRGSASGAHTGLRATKHPRRYRADDTKNSRRARRPTTRTASERRRATRGPHPFSTPVSTPFGTPRIRPLFPSRDTPNKRLDKVAKLLWRSAGIRDRKHIAGAEQLAESPIHSILDIIRKHADHFRMSGKHHPQIPRRETWTDPSGRRAVSNQKRNGRLRIEWNDPSDISRPDRATTLLPSRRSATNSDSFSLGSPHLLQADKSGTTRSPWNKVVDGLTPVEGVRI